MIYDSSGITQYKRPGHLNIFWNDLSITITIAWTFKSDSTLLGRIQLRIKLNPKTAQTKFTNGFP